MDLWEYGQILTIQKSLTTRRSRFSKQRFLIWVYHLYYVIYWVSITNLECESIQKFPFVWIAKGIPSFDGNPIAMFDGAIVDVATSCNCTLSFFCPWQIKILLHFIR
jgi:hypothetical protein